MTDIGSIKEMNEQELVISTQKNYLLHKTGQPDQQHCKKILCKQDRKKGISIEKTYC